MALTRQNRKKRAGSLAVVGLLLALVAASATAQTYDTPGNDQPGSVSAYLSVQATQELEADASNSNPDPEGRYDWANAYSFHNRIISHDSETQGNSTAEVSQMEFLPIEDSTMPYLRVGPKEFTQEFNSAYVSSSYDWADLYDFSGKIAYAISKVATDSDRRIRLNSVSKATPLVDRDPIADLPKVGGGAERTGPGDAAILRVINK